MRHWEYVHLNGIAHSHPILYILLFWNSTVPMKMHHAAYVC